MRLPSISSTVAQDAPSNFDAFVNKQFMQFSTAAVTKTKPTSEQLRNNGNSDLLSSQQQNQQQSEISVQNPSEFISSADEFVKNALNSTSSYCYNQENSFDNFSNNQTKTPSEHEDVNQFNTYRSFKEVNRIFYEECTKSFDDLDLQDPQDIDPILVINSPYPASEFMLKNSINNVDSMKNCAKEDEQQVAQKKSNKNLNTAELTLNNETSEDLFTDNGYDDEIMTDLCAEKSDENEINEIIDCDDYLTSSTSSSLSEHTPKRTFSYFPRGIINPNYPGFQHLAHTLTEHFITGTSLSDSYDSDYSEHEMELSADSLEDLSEEATEEIKLKLNRFNNNFDGQPLYACDMHPDDFLDIELREETRQYNVYDETKTEIGIEITSTEDDNCNTDLRNLPNSLNASLTLLEPVGKICSPEKINSNDCSADNLKYSSTPPDILLKHNEKSLLTATFPKNQNRPDLLYGVSPQHLGNKVKTLEVETNLTRKNFGSPIKDELSLGVTPVDIIGDFGQEVEREFGLLVSGYRRLMDTPTENDCLTQEQHDNLLKHGEKLADAELSKVNDEIDAGKYLAALNQSIISETVDNVENPVKSAIAITSGAYKILNLKNEHQVKNCDFIEDNNAVDWSCETHENDRTLENPIDASLMQNNAPSKVFDNDSTSMDVEKPRYQKAPYDERQLPPVAIEYKRCQQQQRISRKSQHTEKCFKTTKKLSLTNRLLHGKRGIHKSNDKSESNTRKREEAERHQYQQLISDKELILSNSRYAKLSSWAQYLKNSVKDANKQNSTELISPSALELFDAYRIGGEIDRETLQKHLKMAKEIEKKRRSDREEIRRRLAMGTEENSNDIAERPTRVSNTQNGLYICRFKEISSDNESHSSDSETCPKLSKIPQQILIDPRSSTINDQQTKMVKTNSSIPETCREVHPYYGHPLSVSLGNKQTQQKLQQTNLLPITDEDRECDYFTKQARLALSQAKEMAHMQMEFERQNRRMSPITIQIRRSLEKIGVQMALDKRRVSRQMLTDMNIAQLQILVNSLHTHIEDLNESLVQLLMERDDMHVGQDAILADIEELTRFIGAHKKATKCNH